MAGHNFSNWMKGVLTTDGFIKEEIDAWDNAKNSDGTPHYMSFYSETFTQMRRDRRKWVKDRKDEGWTAEQRFNAVYDNYQARHGKSPWDWLDKAYKPPKKADISKASRKRYAARRRRARTRIQRIAES